MQTIIFTRDAQPHELGPADPVYKRGERVDLRPDKAARWLKRRAAELDMTPQPVQVQPDTARGAEVQPEIPENWPDLHWAQRRKIATAIAGEFTVPDGKSMADVAAEIISAEVARRAAASQES